MYKREGVWPVVHIATWEQFEKEIDKKPYRNWIFRGQSNASWKLESSLYRLFADIQKIIEASKGKPRRFSRIGHERQLLRQFKEHAHLYLDTLPSINDDIEWLCLMQRYGTPTRLLDMTFSPYVAAFFALEAGHEDCSVFALRYRYFTELDKDFLGEDYREKDVFADVRGEKSYLFPYEPKVRDERLVTQQGLFLASSNNYQSYDQIISIYDPEPSIKHCVKYVLSKCLRYDGLRKFKLMNISRATLFPGIDGFCESLKFQVLHKIQRLNRLD